MSELFVHDYRGNPIYRYDGDYYFETEEGLVLDNQQKSPQRDYLVWKHGESKNTETLWKEYTR